jgi:hypothetical protein
MFIKSSRCCRADDPADYSPDIAAFAQVTASEPGRMTGTSASRIEEMPAEDVFPDTELQPDAEGRYSPPAAADGRRAIGLRWQEMRQLGRLELHWGDAAKTPVAEGVELQYWHGASPWQGGWKPLSAKLEQSPGVWRWRIDEEKLDKGTARIRWVFPAAKEPPAIKRISAFSRSVWRWAELRAMLDRPTERPARIEVYNGELRKNTALDIAATALDWDTQYGAVFKVLYGEPRQYKGDRTLLRFMLPGRMITVAVEDVLAHECVYVPEAGLFVSINPMRVTKDEYLKRIAGRKKVLDEVRGRPDQTFAQAMRVTHNPVQDAGPMLLSLACDNRKFVADRDGTVHFDAYDRPDGNYADLIGVCMAPQTFAFQVKPTFGDGKGKLRRYLDGDWMPKPTIIIDGGGLTYRQRTFVAPVDESAPAGWPSQYRQCAVCVAEFTIANTGSAEAQAALRLKLSAHDDKPIAGGTLQKNAGVWNFIREGRLLARFEPDKAAPLELVKDGEGLLLQGKLAPGKSASLAVYLPAWPAKADDAAVLGNSDRLAQRCDEYWRGQLAGAMRIDIPDKALADVIRASQVHCMLAARNEAQGRYISPWIASVIYGPLESEAQAIIRGMDMCGNADFSRRGLDYFFARHLHPRGYLAANYTLVGTGEFLWTLSEHYQRTADREWLRQAAPAIVRACQWIARQRAKTKRLDSQGEKVPEYGLMTPGVSADWNRFAYRFFNDAQHCRGLASAAAALAEIDHPDAPAILAEAEEYQADLLRAFRWMQSRMPVVPLADGTWTPNHPSILGCFGDVDEFYFGEDGNRAWAYSVELGGHHLAANRLLDPRSEEVARMMDYMEDRHFFRCGYVDYRAENTRKDIFNFGGFAKLQPYYARNAEIYALRGEAKPFLRSYFNALASLLSAENLSLWEHFHNGGAWNKTHETGWFLAQSAMLFVVERDGELWLASLISDRWLQDGMKVEVRGAPTSFGPVSYKITSAVAQGRIEAEINPPSRHAPKRLVLRLRHPDGKPLRAVEINGRDSRDFDPREGTIVLPTSGERILLRAIYD